MPDFLLEQAVGGRVAGVDEAGRGPLAGPVVAAAVVFPPIAFPRGVPPALARLLDDSKTLSARQRETACLALRTTPGIEFAVGAASVAEIGVLNILHASLLAMRRAVTRLPAVPDHVLVDGNRSPPLSCAVQCVVGGDGLSLSIAAASILAKVARDNAMMRLAQRYPGYGWERNAGYPTELHRAALERLGPTVHHRMGFAGVAPRTRSVDDRHDSRSRLIDAASGGPSR